MAWCRTGEEKERREGDGANGEGGWGGWGGWGGMEKGRVRLGGLIGVLINIQSTFFLPGFTLLYKQCATLWLNAIRLNTCCPVPDCMEFARAFSPPPPPRRFLLCGLHCSAKAQRNDAPVLYMELDVDQIAKMAE